jgi:hypothetical protein
MGQGSMRDMTGCDVDDYLIQHVCHDVRGKMEQALWRGTSNLGMYLCASRTL